MIENRGLYLQWIYKIDETNQEWIIFLSNKIFQVGGVSTTGHGESITKTCLAHTAVINMEQGY